MDITNETKEPVIVEAERGGGGNEPDPPFRYGLRKGNPKHYDKGREGGAIRVPQGKTMVFKEVEKFQKLVLHAFGQHGDYAGCYLASNGNATGGGSYVLKKRNGKYVIEETQA